MPADRNFRHLNLRNEWPNFALTGLRVGDEGELTLALVPSVVSGGTVPPGFVPSLEGPAGIGVDDQGNLYVADLDNNRITRVDGCDGTQSTLSCLTGPGSDPGQLNGPRGVIVGPRRALYIADSGNHRVQVVDLAMLQVRGIWGQPDPWGEPQPGTDPGRLNDPWDLATDTDGWVYVVDHGNHRVQRFDADGRPDPTFWETMQGQPEVPAEPSYITVTKVDGAERLLVVDRTGPRILAYATDGTFDQQTSAAWQDLPIDEIGGVLFVDGVLYVGDPRGQLVLSFDAQGRYLGAAAGYLGPVASLTLDLQGRLLVHPGHAGAVSALAPGLAYTTNGTFLAGPFSVSDRATRWHRLKAWAETLPANAHLRLATYASEGATPPVWDPLAVDPNTGADPALTPANAWRSAPRDALDLLILHEPAQNLWIAGVFDGDGTVSPTVHQMRLSFDHDSYLRYLPAIYRGADPMAGFLARALEVFESELGDAELAVDQLGFLFDAHAASNVGSPASWLDWLSTWLAFELSEAWPEQRRREAVAGAFQLAGIRGTLEGLKRYVELYTGAKVRIDEPARQGALWTLGDSSVLGFTTMLVPAEAQGVVAGTTAVLDQSHLIGEQDYGARLFDDLAHRFCIEVYQTDAPTAERQVAMASVLDAEKPAHTTYELCVIGPRMRVGFQARIGIDTIVAGLPPALTLGDDLRLGTDTVLPVPEGGPPAARLDGDTRIGSAPMS
jgi:phage tail-like protein